MAERIPHREIKDFSSASRPSERAKHAQAFGRTRHELRVLSPESTTDQHAVARAFLATLSYEQRQVVRQMVSAKARLAEKRFRRNTGVSLPNIKPPSKCDEDD